MGYVRRAMENDVLNFLGDLVREARAQGADEADAVDIDSRSLDAAVRLGKIEHMERSELRKTGLRVLVGRRQAIVATADRQAETASALVERAVAMARAAPEDPHAGLAEPALLAQQWPELDLYDDAETASEDLVRNALEAEAAGARRRGCHQFRGRRRQPQRGPRRARLQQRVRGRLPEVGMRAVRVRSGGRGHGDGKRI